MPKMAHITCAALFLASLALPIAATVSYDGHQAIRLSIKDDHEVVDELISRFDLDTWRHTWTYTDVLIAPRHLDAFNNDVRSAGLEVTVLDPDVGKSIAAGPIAERSMPVSGDEEAWLTSWHDNYHHMDEHYKWLSILQSKYHRNAELMSFGSSHQGEGILATHIFAANRTRDQPKPAVVFHGTVHAREWITAMVIEYAAEEILKLSNDSEHPIWDFEYYFFPVVNPDGFRYSQKEDRLWRKSREWKRGNKCIGVDLNRNWPHMWDVPGGSSSNPCDQTYRGAGPGASMETSALIDAFDHINMTNGGVYLYIDWHSYSQVLMSPHGYTCEKLPDNHEQLQKLMKGAVAALNSTHGTQYTAGPICDIMYPVSGSSVDYVHDIIRARNTLGVELRPDGRGMGNGFLLPSEQIRPSGEETWEAIKYMLESISGQLKEER